MTKVSKHELPSAGAGHRRGASFQRQNQADCDELRLDGDQQGSGAGDRVLGAQGACVEVEGPDQLVAGWKVLIATVWIALADRDTFRPSVFEGNFEMHFRAFVSAAVAATFIAGPLQAQSANTYEVVRLNDNAMTCEALVGEINSLSNELRQQTANAARASRNRQTAGAVGRGLLSGLAQGASMFGVGGDGIGGAVAASAISGLANHAASAAATAPTEQPQAAPPSPQAERLAHLNNLNRSRSC